MAEKKYIIDNLNWQGNWTVKEYKDLDIKKDIAGLGAFPHLGASDPRLRKDVVSQLGKMKDDLGITDFFKSGFNINSAHRATSAQHSKWTALDAKPLGDMTWQRLDTSFETHGFITHIHPNYGPGYDQGLKYLNISPADVDKYDVFKVEVRTFDKATQKIMTKTFTLHKNDLHIHAAYQGEYNPAKYRSMAEPLNKDLSSNLKKGGTTGQAASITHQGEEIAKGVAEQKLSADNAYTHPEVNTDVTQRVLSKDGTIASPAKLEGSVSKTGLAASSAPAGLNKVFKTPNMESITKVLYSGVKLGASMLTGYLMGRATEMVLGKEGSKIAGKIQEYKSYYNLATKAMQTYASSAWSAITHSAFGQAISSAWTALSHTLVGQAVAWVSSAISAVTSAITSAIVSAVYAIAGAVATAATAIGGAIMSAIAWVAALAIPW